jgi:hypothetical protein
MSPRGRDAGAELESRLYGDAIPRPGSHPKRNEPMNENLPNSHGSTPLNLFSSQRKKWRAAAHWKGKPNARLGPHIG